MGKNRKEEQLKCFLPTKGAKRPLVTHYTWLTAGAPMSMTTMRVGGRGGVFMAMGTAHHRPTTSPVSQ